MKTNFFFLSVIAFALFSACTFKPKDPQDLEKFLKEKRKESGVQFAKTTLFEYQSGKLDTNTAFLSKVVEFDKNGNKIREEIYKKNNPNENTVNELIYDENENLIQIITKNTEGIEVYRIEYTYENNNPVKEVHKRDGTNLIGSLQYTYQNDKKTKRIFFTPEGTLQNKIVYTYNDNGNLYEILYCNEEGTVHFKDKYIYNKKNKLVEEQNIDKDKKVIRYNKVNQLSKYKTEWQKYNGQDELKYTTTILLNKEGQVLEEEHTMNEPETPFFMKNEFKYNKNGLVTECIHFGVNKKPETYEKTEYSFFQK